MSKHEKVAELVRKAYEASSESFAQWMWQNHVPVVARYTEELAKRFEANAELAVAGAWLHDFGDAFMDRFAEGHEETTDARAREALLTAGYSESEISQVMNEVIAPHSCKDGVVPTTIEGKVMAAGDALAHLTTDFYVQFAWLHLPAGKRYPEFLEWVKEKLERDFHAKIFFPEIQAEVHHRYEALKEVFLGN